MVERGESSRAAEECRDIPVDSERLVTHDPMEPEVRFRSDSEEEEFRGVPMAEPVRGGVMRAGSSSSSSEPEEDSVPDTTPEASDEDIHIPPDHQPAEYPDGMGSTAEDIIEGMTVLQEQLETRVLHLEVQNQLHQEHENQYRDLAYQALGEKGELEGQLAARDQQIATLEEQLQQAQSSAVRAGSLVHHVVARSAVMSQQWERSELEMAGLQEELAAMRARCEREAAYRAHMEHHLTRSEREIQILEGEFRRRDSRTESFDHALTTSFGRLRRRMLNRMARREIRRAVRRSRR